MKSIRIHHLATLLVPLLTWFMSSCSSDEPEEVLWDFVPVNFKIEVETPAGNIINNESDDWTMLIENISIEYDGQTYTPREDNGLMWGNDTYQVIPRSRELPAIFKGLYYYTYNYDDYNPNNKNCLLYFGEFSVTDDYTLNFKINWPDGTSSEVKFENKFSWKNKEPKIKNELWIDGKKQQNSYIVHHRLK